LTSARSAYYDVAAVSVAFLIRPFRWTVWRLGWAMAWICGGRSEMVQRHFRLGRAADEAHDFRQGRKQNQLDAEQKGASAQNPVYPSQSMSNPPAYNSSQHSFAQPPPYPAANQAGMMQIGGFGGLVPGGLASLMNMPNQGAKIGD
jgi:hypothetical protein